MEQGAKDRHELFELTFGEKITNFQVDEGLVHPELNIVSRHEDNWRMIRGLLNVLEVDPDNIESVSPDNAIQKEQRALADDILAIGSWKSTASAKKQWKSFDENVGINNKLRWNIGQDQESPTKRYLMTDVSFSDPFRDTSTFHPPEDFHGDRDIWEVPNRHLIDIQDGLNGRPEVDDDGFLTSDYLVITKAPNYISEEAYDRGKDFVQISGCHGLGTRAIINIFRNKQLLEELAEKAQGTEYFQATYEVSEIEHSDTTTNSRPVSIKPATELWGDDWFHPIKNI